MMKKLILSIMALASIVAMSSCSKTNRWSEHERAKVRDEVKNYRDRAYLNSLEELEFEEFSNNVVDAIEVDYPVYTAFVELPGRGDTVQVYVVSTIVSELHADAHNMRKIYPYHTLVKEGILPKGLDRQAQRAFYECFARRVNNTYTSTTAFVNAVLADTTSSSQIAQMQSQCAADLFDWTVEIDEVILYE
jgi:hypothetical protein